MSKNTILKGTFILTAAGLVTRLIGFVYKIYLADLLGAEMMGVYQLVFPVYGLCFTLYASGIQTSISRLIAAELGRKNSGNIKKVLLTGMAFSVTIALILSYLIYQNSDYIAVHLLTEQRAASSLKILIYAFPFCGITACINGYYYGIKKTNVPALTQLLEQIVRVFSVYLFSSILGGNNLKNTCELAVIGIVLGEIASNLFNLISLTAQRASTTQKNRQLRNPRSLSAMKGSVAGEIVKLTLPLTANRLFINILQSLEAVLIPNMLKKSGLSTSEALSVYGILTGMSIPFIMFPSTITNSLAVMLLPAVSEAQAAKNNNMIRNTTALSVKYSLLIGLFSTGIFLLFGKSLGSCFFHNQLSGKFLMTLSFLCPFLYLTTTLGSILNGLGKAHLTFLNTITGLSVRIFFVLYFVPKNGIAGYLIGLLVSQLIISTMDVISIIRNVPFQFDAFNWLLKPALFVFIAGIFFQNLYFYLRESMQISPIMLLFIICTLFAVLYLLLLLLSQVISKKEFKKG